MTHTYTQNYDIMGDSTVYEILSSVNINPITVQHSPSSFCKDSYDITFKTFNDMMTFTRGYFEDFSDEEIYEVMGWNITI